MNTIPYRSIACIRRGKKKKKIAGCFYSNISKFLLPIDSIQLYKQTNAIIDCRLSIYYWEWLVFPCSQLYKSAAQQMELFCSYFFSFDVNFLSSLDETEQKEATFQ